MVTSFDNLDDQDAAVRDAEVIVNQTDEDLVNAFIIIGQADPTAMDAAGVLVFDEAQREMIIKAKSTISEW